jgi:hypothetical protein
MKLLCSSLIALTILATAVRAQNAAAQLTGRITDPSGAVIPSAAITVRNTDTGGGHNSTSNDAGYYAVPSLDPGNYEVLVQHQGFKPVHRAGIQLHVNQAAELDFALQVGDMSDAITVHAEAPLLESTEGALGAVVDNTKVLNLPLNGRDPFDLVLLTPGTQAYSRGVLPGNNIPLSNFSTNGGPPLSNEILLDGVPDTTIVQNQFVIIPSVDATQEFKVQSNSIKAEFGHTGGGVVNVSLKSGTNQFHGVAFDFLRNDKLQADDWFNNRSGVPRSPFRFNQFGGTFGGPVVHDRTFFFVNYEGIRRIQGRTTILTIARDDMRGGDFSQVQDSSGRQVNIYSPLTTRANPDGTYVRDPFPGNRIPVNLMDPVALKMLTYWPHANIQGDPRTGANNFISTAGEQYGVNQFNTRIDHTISSSHQLFGRLSWDKNYVNPPNVFGNIANPSSGSQSFTQWNAGINDSWTARPTTVVTFRLGFSRLHDFAQPYGQGFDITQLGFPAGYAKAQTAPQFPQINVTGMVTPSPLGFGTSALGAVDDTTFSNRQNAYSGQSDATIIRGRHIIKFGADTRVYRVDGTRATNGAGTFSFTPGFTQGPNPTVAGPTSGNAFASYLLGTAGSGSLGINPTQDFQQYYLGSFVQDDLKVTTRLTLNLGVRYEIESSRTDRYNRLSWDDFASVSPLHTAAGLGPIRGGLAFAAVNGNPRSQANGAYNNWGPRFGFAYNAAGRLVVRGGYGMFYSPRMWQGIGQFGQVGFSASTPFVPSVDGFTPVNSLRNPFPNGYNAPTGSSLGLLIQVGQAVSGPDRSQGSPNVQQWNFGLQTTLPGRILLEPAYAGSKGSHLMQNLGFNQIPNADLALGNELLRQVPNPFLGQIPANTSLGLATISEGQLLRPYPQFTGFTAVRSTSGSSIYHSFQLRIERQMANGLTFLASYTFSKLIDDGSPGAAQSYNGENPGFQNLNNRRLERSLSSQNLAQHFVTSFVYELPFGRGKHFLSGVSGPAGFLVGGWQINGIVTLQDGIPLSLGTTSNPTLGAVGSGGLRPNNNGHSAARSGPIEDRLNSYFDTSVFSQPAPFQFGNTARTLPNVRAPGIADFDLSGVKNSRIKERYNIQFRAEFFNAFNHPNFFLPNVTFGSPGFGTISSINPSAPARIIQLALKLYF